ncbi:MAG: mobile mystery protein A [Mariprofundaceae bacterium]|nr:mobile mystery protein A [Mariprofundaceae bacterium]
MAYINKAIIRQQLDKKLQSFANLKDSPPPIKGWIRAIRDALGMTGEQLARRIGVQKQRVAALEKAEVEGSVTINSMKKAAEAMDCVFVYALVPRDSLEANVERQARKHAEKLHYVIQHSMVLEQQGLTADESGQGIQANTDKFVRETVKDMWDMD